MSDIKNKSQFVICGTDTDIGKTLISSFFVRGLNSFYWKPIQSGIGSETDSQTVARIAKMNKSKHFFHDLLLFEVCYLLSA